MSQCENTVVKIREGQGFKNFFFIYDGEGEIIPYLNLANKLPSEFTVFGIMPETRPDIPQIHLSVKSMAQSCIQQMKHYQEQGPYYFGGLCAGGVISFEMTRQLEQSGDTMGCLLLLEAVEPHIVPRKSLSRTRVDRFRQVFTNNKMTKKANHQATNSNINTSVWLSAIKKIYNVVTYETLSFFNAIFTHARLKLLHKVLKNNADWPKWIKPLSIREIYYRARDTYQPGTIETDKTILVKGTEAIDGVPGDEPAIELFKEMELGWKPYMNNKITILNVAGGHSSMLQEPYVKDLASQLSSALNK